MEFLPLNELLISHIENLMDVALKSRLGADVAAIESSRLLTLNPLRNSNKLIESLRLTLVK